MTVLDRLISTGSQEPDARRAAAAIGSLLPVGQEVRVTDEVLDAARSGNLVLVAMLLSEEVEAEPDEAVAIARARLEDDGVRYSRAEIVAEFGS
jgi:hypothetical protein